MLLKFNLHILPEWPFANWGWSALVMKLWGTKYFVYFISNTLVLLKIPKLPPMFFRVYFPSNYILYSTVMAMHVGFGLKSQYVTPDGYSFPMQSPRLYRL